MSFESKLIGIETDILMDKEIFDFWYEKMPLYRKKKIDAMKPEKGKRASLGAGILLAKGLEMYGIEDAEIDFGPNGKPCLKGRDDLFFNLSHSGDMAVCAFAGTEIGADVEQNTAFKENLINYVFDEREKDYISSLGKDEEEINAGFTSLWTMKESIMKYSGKGISMSPKEIFVDLENGSRIYYKGEELKDYFLRTFEYRDYQICVCKGDVMFEAGLEFADISIQ